MKINGSGEEGKTNPIQTQFKANQSQFKANQSQFQSKTNPIKPNFHEFLPIFALPILITCAFGANFLTKSQKTGQEQTFLAAR